MAKTYLLVRLVDLIKSSQQVPEWSELSSDFRNKIAEIFGSEESACESYNFLIRTESFPLFSLEKFFAVIQDKKGWHTARKSYKELYKLFLEEKNSFDKKLYIESQNHNQKLTELKQHIKTQYDYTASTEDLRKIVAICSLQDKYSKAASVLMRKFLDIDRISSQEVKQLGDMAKKSIVGSSAEHHLERLANAVEYSDLEVVITAGRSDIIKYIALKDIAHLLPGNINFYGAWGAPALSDNMVSYLQENPLEPGSRLICINNGHVKLPITDMIENPEGSNEVIECRNVFGEAIIDMAERLSQLDADSDELLSNHKSENFFIHRLNSKDLQTTQATYNNESTPPSINQEAENNELNPPKIQGVNYTPSSTSHAKTYLFVNSFNLLRGQVYPEWSQLDPEAKDKWAQYLGSPEEARVFYSKFIRTLPNTSKEGIKNHIFKILAQSSGGRFKAWDKHHKLAELFAQECEKFNEERAQIEDHNNAHNYWKMYKKAFCEKYGISSIKEEDVERAHYLASFLENIHAKGADSIIKNLLGCKQVSEESYKKLIDSYLQASTTSSEDRIITDKIKAMEGENFEAFICYDPRTSAVPHYNPEASDSNTLDIEPSTLPYVNQPNIVKLVVEPWIEAASPPPGSTILIVHHEGDKYTTNLEELQQQHPDLRIHSLQNVHGSALAHLAQEASAGGAASNYCQEVDNQLIFIDTSGEGEPFNLYETEFIDVGSI
jgi:hypothetical protein